MRLTLPTLCSLAFCMLLLACSSEPPTPTDESAVVDARTVGPLAPWVKPAYALPGERRSAGKADQYDDYRAEYPELFAITAPPAGTFRHMREWEPMQAMIITYEDWPENNAEVRKMYVEMVKATVPVAEVWVVHPANSQKTQLLNELDTAGVDASKVKFFQMPVQTIWHIDYGPLPLIDEEAGTYAFADFNYYHGRPQDDAVPTRLGQVLGVNTYRYETSYEGGNLQGDGQGGCYTTQRGLQQSGLSKADFDKGHKDYLACDNVHYLKDIWNDGTGHVDMFFKLVAHDKAVLGYYKDSLGDAKAQKDMDDNEDLLKAIALADGKTMTVYRLPMPGLGFEAEAGGGLKPTTTPFTYINSTLINGVNLWPIFSYEEWDESKAEALAVWKEALPEYEHIGIIADRVSLASGAIHCITRTVPAYAASKWIPDGTCEGGACAPAAGFEELGATNECQPDDDVCFGPAWLCNCNSCSKGCAEPVDECGGFVFEGCCMGDVLFWCEDGNSVKQQDCPAGTCGWDQENNYYGCQTSGGESPNPETLPKECTASCEPKCNGKACGSDGCGGSCGTCSHLQNCNSQGQCVEKPVECTDECDSLGERGCNAAGEPWLCTNNLDTGCNIKGSLGACSEGKVCNEGHCIDGPDEPTDTTDPVDGTDPTDGTDGNNSTGGTGGNDSTEPPASLAPGGDGDSGCSAAGGSGGPSLPTLLLVTLTMAALLRRRRLPA